MGETPHDGAVVTFGQQVAVQGHPPPVLSVVVKGMQSFAELLLSPTVHVVGSSFQVLLVRWKPKLSLFYSPALCLPSQRSDTVTALLTGEAEVSAGEHTRSFADISQLGACA